VKRTVLGGGGGGTWWSRTLSAAESQTTWSGSKQDQASPERNVCGQKSYINVEPRVLKKNRGCLKSSPCVSISISARAVHRLPLFDESNLRSSFFSPYHTDNGGLTPARCDVPFAIWSHVKLSWVILRLSLAYPQLRILRASMHPLRVWFQTFSLGGIAPESRRKCWIGLMMR